MYDMLQYRLHTMRARILVRRGRAAARLHLYLPGYNVDDGHCGPSTVADLA